MKSFSAPGKCPTCGYVFEECSHVKAFLHNQVVASAPMSGDLSLCIECGEVLRFERINGALQIFKSEYRSAEILRLQEIIRSKEAQQMKAKLRKR